MDAFRPILLEELDLQLPGVRLRQLTLNRHLARMREVAAHSHAVSQLILYLGGGGLQIVEGARHAIGPGVLVHIPAGSAHGFHSQMKRAPLALVIDLDWQLPPGRADLVQAPRVRQLGHQQLRAVRTCLGRLSELRERRLEPLDLQAFAVILELLEVLLAELEIIRRKPPRHVLHPAVRKVRERLRELLAQQEIESLSLEAAAAEAELQPDYLNRLLRRDLGLTFGQLRSQLRLEEAQKALRADARVGEAAERAGFEDLNYFARWFRRQTGQAPSAWQKEQRSSG
jgi:AraC-like DNA-binding protein